MTAIAALILCNLEAVTGRVLKERVFLEISQNLWEDTFARVSFLIKLQAFTTLPFL